MMNDYIFLIVVIMWMIYLLIDKALDIWKSKK